MEAKLIGFFDWFIGVLKPRKTVTDLHVDFLKGNIVPNVDIINSKDMPDYAKALENEWRDLLSQVHNDRFALDKFQRILIVTADQIDKELDIETTVRHHMEQIKKQMRLALEYLRSIEEIYRRKQYGGSNLSNQISGFNSSIRKIKQIVEEDVNLGKRQKEIEAHVNEWVGVMNKLVDNLVNKSIKAHRNLRTARLKT